jgi:hypothetical protein
MSGLRPAFSGRNIGEVFVVPLLFSALTLNYPSGHAACELGRHADDCDDVIAAINRLRSARGVPSTSLGEIVAGHPVDPTDPDLALV